MRRFYFGFVLSVLFLWSGTLYAQVTTLDVSSPTDGASVDWPIRVTGKAPVGVKLRFRLNDELVHTIDATTSSTFDVSLKTATRPKLTKVTVASIPPNGEMEIVVLTVAVRAPTPPKPVVTTPVKPNPIATSKPKPESKPKVVTPAVVQPKTTTSPNTTTKPATKSATETTIVVAPDASTQKQPTMPRARTDSPGFGNRLVSELFFGALISAGGGILGGVVAWQVNNQVFGSDAPVKTFAIISGAYLGTSILMPLGIYTGGRVSGGQGSFLLTLGVGLASTGGAIAFALDNDTSTGAALTALAVAPIVGSLLGYELSHAIWGDSTDPTPRAPSLKVSILPMPDGMGFGAMGQF